jgi:3-oxoacyl-[acyl-carrier-protein] synthase III
MSKRPFVFGISHSTGRRIPIAKLAEVEGVPPATIASLQSRGLCFYRDESRSVHEVLFEVASSSLAKAGCVVADIDCVVMVNSPVDEEQLLKTLSIAGFERAWLLGLGYQDCGGSEAAMRIASDLILGGSRAQRILVVLYGKVAQDKDRIGWGGETIFSDGASAFVVSAAESGLEILSSEVLTNPKLPWFREIGPQAKYFEECLASMSGVAKRALRLAGIDISNVSRVFATNGSTVYHGIIASALGISTSKIHTEDMAEFGHVFSSDGLIGLSNHLAASGILPGQYFMLVSWSPTVFGASILRHSQGIAVNPPDSEAERVF